MWKGCIATKSYANQDYKNPARYIRIWIQKFSKPHPDQKIILKNKKTFNKSKLFPLTYADPRAIAKQRQTVS